MVAGSLVSEAVTSVEVEKLASDLQIQGLNGCRRP